MIGPEPDIRRRSKNGPEQEYTGCNPICFGRWAMVGAEPEITERPSLNI